MSEDGDTKTAWQDILPERYRESWTAPFHARIYQRLTPGMTILDIGGGRHPALPRGERSEGSVYIGLDVDADELSAAATGEYDRTIAADAAMTIPGLAGTVDLAISWQVFEHVRSLEMVLDNVHGYLKPGGTLVSLFSGRWSIFAMVNRLLPKRIGFPIVDRVSRRTARNKPIFPAFYDGCSYTALSRLMGDWQSVEIIPLYNGAVYFSFARPAMRAYLAYENTIRRLGWHNAATHYLLVATR